MVMMKILTLITFLLSPPLWLRSVLSSPISTPILILIPHSDLLFLGKDDQPSFLFIILTPDSLGNHEFHLSNLMSKKMITILFSSQTAQLLRFAHAHSLLLYTSQYKSNKPYSNLMQETGNQ
jgi:hypothetical protein